MSAAQIVIVVCLSLAGLSALLTGIGVLALGSAYDRLHFGSLVGIFGTLAVVVAILVQESFSQGGVKTILTALVLLITDPVLTHATARAARAREAPDRPDQPPDARRIVP